MIQLLYELMGYIPDESLEEILSLARANSQPTLLKTIGRELHSRQPTNNNYQEFGLQYPFERSVFPTSALVEPLRTFVSDGAKAVGVPPEFIALPLLGICGALIGSKVKIRVKSTWLETPQLWLAVVGEPGSAKTPAQMLARRPLIALQKEAIEAFTAEMKDYENELRDWEDGPSRSATQKPTKPKRVSFWTQDATLEALAVVLEDSGSTVCVRDELVSWVRSHDAYRKAGDRQSFLSLWSGESIKIDRKTSDSIYIPDPVVSVVGGIQPEMLRDLAEEAGRRDGFVERFLWAFPEHQRSLWTDDEIEDGIIHEVTTVFRNLRELSDADLIVRMSSEAHAHWIEWYNANQELLSSVSGVLQGIYAKLPIQLARITLILHCLESFESPIKTQEQVLSRVQNEIGIQTLAGGIEMIEFFRVQAHNVAPHFGVSVLPSSSYISPERQQILRFHTDNGAGSSTQVADALGMNFKSVNNMQRRMLERGLLTQPSRGVYDVSANEDESSVQRWNRGTNGKLGTKPGKSTDSTVPPQEESRITPVYPHFLSDEWT